MPQKEVQSDFMPRSRYTTYLSSLKGIAREINNKESKAIIVVWGDNDYFLHKSTEYIQKAWKKSKQASVQTLSTKDLEGEQSFKSIWQQRSLFEASPMYCLKQLEKHRAVWKYFSCLPSSSKLQAPLCLNFKGSKLPVPLKKELDRLEAIYLPCFAPYTSDYPAIIKTIFKKYGLEITADTADFLLDVTGEDLYKLDNEIKKLSAIFVDQKTSLSVDHVSKYLGMLRVEHAFRLTDLLIQQKQAEAHILLSDLIERGNSAIAILGIISRHIRSAIRIHQAKQAGASLKQLSSTLRLPINIINSYNQYTRQVPLTKLMRSLTCCQIADMELKGLSKSSETLILSKVLNSLSPNSK